VKVVVTYPTDLTVFILQEEKKKSGNVGHAMGDTKKFGNKDGNMG
jgi:hypothetical protein